MTSPAKLTVALVQQSNTDNAKDNMAKSISAIREAAQKGAKLVVLQSYTEASIFAKPKMLTYLI